MNQIDPNIKFTWDCISFLDTQVYRSEDNKLAICPYKKETDHNTYLHFISFYPIHLRQSISFSQFLRLWRNFSNHFDYLKESRTLAEQFRDRGYPAQVIDQAQCEVALAKENPYLWMHLEPPVDAP